MAPTSLVAWNDLEANPRSPLVRDREDVSPRPSQPPRPPCPGRMQSPAPASDAPRRPTHGDASKEAPGPRSLLLGFLARRTRVLPPIARRTLSTRLLPPPSSLMKERTHGRGGGGPGGGPEHAGPGGGFPSGGRRDVPGEASVTDGGRAGGDPFRAAPVFEGELCHPPVSRWGHLSLGIELEIVL
ncbi:homeobox protein Hox-B3-like [Penaeus indicus]|uniref:homeobox protein Hox-B3-like n=1 Tax=Penaeus indicus TaxID=29960 RepID=UPI00300D1349